VGGTSESEGEPFEDDQDSIGPSNSKSLAVNSVICAHLVDDRVWAHDVELPVVVNGVRLIRAERTPPCSTRAISS